MKKQAISYETVRDQITDMLLAGEKLTVRNVIAKTGGKTTIIADYLKRWHLENDEQQEYMDNHISEEFAQAILTDRSFAVTMAVGRYKTQVTYLEKMIDELNEIIKNRETQLEAQETEIHSLNEKHIVQNALFNAQIKSTESIMVELKQQLANTLEKLGVVDNEKHEAIKQAAVWQAKYEQLLQNK